MDIEKFKIFEGEHKGMEVNQIIDMIHTLQQMSDTLTLMKTTKPKKVKKSILAFLAANEENLPPETIQKIKYIAQIWSDAFEGMEIVHGLKRRVDPLIKELKALE